MVESIDKSVPEEVRYRDVCINLSEGSVTKNGVEVPVTKREFLLTVYLMRTKNTVMKKERLMEIAWGKEVPDEIRILDNHIRQIREKLQWGDCLVSYLDFGYELL